uniref:Uncharacterized protein n=1 Tax=Crocodylus porosus TaxID=8502 RepID=A0A7M4E0S9_CROPO
MKIAPALSSVNHPSVGHVTELTQHIQAKATLGASPLVGENGAEFVCFFPTFVVVVGDCGPGTSEPTVSAAGASPHLSPGDNQHVEAYILPQLCLRCFFLAHKRFVFEQPAHEQDLCRLEELRDDRLDLRVHEQADHFCTYIWGTAQTKALPGGHVVTAKLLGDLVVTYVDATRSRAVPCLESAVLALAQVEDAAAVEDAVARYQVVLGREVALPTETLAKLLVLHAQAECKALTAFMARAFTDNQQEELCQRNERASLQRCQAVLAEVSHDLDAHIRDRAYTVPSSYQHFLGDQEEMVEHYWQVLGNGIKVGGWMGRDSRGGGCNNTPPMPPPAQRARAETAAREQELLRQEQAELRQKLEEQRRSHEEHVRQLMGSLEKERMVQLEQLDQTAVQKLQVRGQERGRAAPCRGPGLNGG